MSRLFDGIDDHLTVDSAVVTTTPFTMGCWFYSPADPSSKCLMFVGDKDVADNYHALFTASTTTVQAYTKVGALDGLATSGAAGSTVVGRWAHAAAVFASAADRRVFIDGGAKGTNTNSRTPAGLDRTAIGMRRTSSPGGPSNSRIAEAAIWDVALTDGEIAALGKGVSPLLIRPASLVFYAPIWGVSSPERDYTRGQRHMTVTGATLAPHAPVMIPPGLEGFWTPPGVAAVAPNVIPSSFMVAA